MEILGIIFASGLVVLLFDIFRCLILSKRRKLNFFNVIAYVFMGLTSVTWAFANFELFESFDAWSCSILLSLFVPRVIDKIVVFIICEIGQIMGLKTSLLIF